MGACEEGAVEGGLSPLRLAPDEDLLPPQLEAHVHEVLPVLAAGLPVLDDPHYCNGLLVRGDVEEVLPALGKAAGVAHLQTVLLAGDDPEELDALPTVEFHVGNILVVPEGVLGSADVGVLGGYREGFQHL